MSVETAAATSALVGQAWADADAAIRRARIDVRTLDTVAALTDVRRLFDRIWHTDPSSSPVPADLMVAMRKAGSYVSGAFDGDELVGACLGFFGAPAHQFLHSHIAGVLPHVQGRDIGFALKLHQRAWAVTRGAYEIRWTYDPLIRRNAHFNLAKLGAGVAEYLPDFYGPIDDGVNHGDASDRLLVRWVLDAPTTAAACRGEHPAVRRNGGQLALEVSADGRPVAHPVRGDVVLVGVPADIEAVRAADPRLATEWRSAVRDVLGGLLADGATVRGFDRAGWYVLDRDERTEQS
ncbi:MAG TPA: GNAT family N-acetyltransferase [Nocardioides sp.]|nr:GNAT family N-acetyltransferase [Nocardioides sp.]